jgi:hypothetical protein
MLHTEGCAMRNIAGLLAITCLLLPGTGLARSDGALAKAADNCNTTAYNALKPNRSVSGARDLMTTSSEGRKYAKWMKKYLGLIATCKAKPYMPDCKPASKIDGYQTRLKDSKEKLKKNMMSNYLCNVTLVNKYASRNTPATQINSEVEDKVKKELKIK